MAPRAISLLALLTLAVGCSRPLPSTPLERGEVLLRSGDYDQALAALTEAVTQDPTSGRAHLLRGRAYHCRNAPGDIDTAVTDFTEAIRLNAKDHEALYSRSIAYRDLGKLAESKQDEVAARNLDEDAAREARSLPELSPPLLPFETPLAAEPSDATKAAADPEDNESAEDLVKRLRSEAMRADDSGTTRSTEADDYLDELQGSSQGKESDSTFNRGSAASSAGNGSPSSANPGGAAAPWLLPYQDDPLLNPRGPHSRVRGQSAAGSQAPARSPYVTPGFQSPAPGLDARATGGSSRSPYQSPIPQRAPRPTGYVPEPLFPGAQPAAAPRLRTDPVELAQG